MSSISTDVSPGLQLDPKTARALGRFAQRRRLLLLLRGIAAGIVFFVLTMGLVALCDYLWLLSDPARWMLSAIGYAVTVWAVWWFGLRELGDRDARKIARQLESSDPRLREDLLSAVELADPQSANGSAGFRRWLQKSVASRAAGIEVSRLLPVGLIQRWLFAGMLVVFAFLALMLVPRMQFGRRIARAMLPGVPIQRASLTNLSILKPSPPSGFVAEGDAVAVVTQVSGRAVEEVTLQWRNSDGIEGETPMTPRMSSEQNELGDTLAFDSLYAANLSVGTTPIEYRVLAGDAVSLWNQLTPLPRPRVKSFEKHYEFPDYANLPDRTEESEHGDLRSLIGTKAVVKIRFDEPVDEATIRYGNRGAAIQLDSVEGSSSEYLATIPIRTPGTYQVDAISSRSGLNNPFGPQYSISPVIDSAPIASWQEELPRLQIVSPLDVVSLAATATDDLPFERVVQEFQVNGTAVAVRQIKVDGPGREHRLDWEWDLLNRTGEEEPSVKLSSGDMIRTRVVAIDRNSQRGESSFLEILIAEDDFDSDRHSRMEELKEASVQVADWSLRMNQWFDAMNPLAVKSTAEQLQKMSQEMEVLQEESTAVLQSIERVMMNAPVRPEAGALELLGRAVADLAQDQMHWMEGLEQAKGEEHGAWSRNRDKVLREHAQNAKRHSQNATKIRQYARHLFGEELTVSLLRDLMSLQRSLQPLVDRESNLPLSRFPRYLVVILGRLQAIDQMIMNDVDATPDSTKRHLENWERVSNSWYARLKAAAQEPPKEDAFRALLAQFDRELGNQVDHGIIDGRLASTINNLLRELRIEIGPSSDLVRQMAKHGQEMERAQKDKKGEADSKAAARLLRDERFAIQSFERARSHLLERIEREEELHRSRPNVDLRFAADMKLMRRAIENVSQEGYGAYREEPAPSVYQNLAIAYQVIEAKHEADLWLAEIRDLMLAERRLENTAVAKVKHASWLERFASGLEWPARTLQNAGIDWRELEAIDRARHNDDFQQARNRITTRRWSGDPMLSAESALEILQTDLATNLASIEPRVVAARATIERYVLSLAEQARQAAKLAKEAEQRTAARSDSSLETSEQLEEQQRQVDEATRETLESLVDLANTASLTDAEDRELARDADIAAAEIQQASKRAEESIKDATQAPSDEKRSEALQQSEQALNELSAALEKTAEHFEDAQNGEDVSESRAELRELEAAMREQGELQDRYDRAEEMADAAQSSPEEMLQKLEEELKENEPMQQELSEIARRAAEAAQRSLEQAARDEKAIGQSLEKSDFKFQERKQRAAREIASLLRRSNAVDQSLLQATGRAIGWGNVPKAGPKLDEARATLRDAVAEGNQMGGDRATLSDMREVANNLDKAIESATRSLESLSEATGAAQDEDIHRDAASRKRSQDQVDRFARDARSQQIRAVGSERQQWNSASQDAARRMQTAQRQRRDVENQKRRMEQRLSREPKNAKSLETDIAKAEVRIERANEAEEAARETKDFAVQRGKEASARENAIKKKRIEKNDKPNPAAQLATRMSDEASQEMSDIREALARLSDEMNFGDQLRAPEAESKSLADRQQRIESEVEEASEQLRRAARHEQRLGQEELSQQLESAADVVSEQASAAAKQAQDKLKQAAAQAEASPEANQQVARAAEEIQAAADRLAQMLETSMPQESGSADQAQSESSDQQSGEELAQTLDELDRQIASAQQPGEQQSGQGEPGQDQKPQQGDAANSEQGQQGQANSNQPPTAQDASPTLANAMDSQSQQAAKERQEQLNPSQGQSQGGQPGEPTSQSASSSSATKPGSGEMPGGGSIDTGGIDRDGSEWGQLRTRRTDDVSQARGATVAPQYRREIEAYFRAIARRAAEKQD